MFVTEPRGDSSGNCVQSLDKQEEDGHLEERLDVGSTPRPNHMCICLLAGRLGARNSGGGRRMSRARFLTMLCGGFHAVEWKGQAGRFYSSLKSKERCK